MEVYMHERMGIPWESIPAMRTDLYAHYGTTLRGLHCQYGIDEREFLAYVHDIPLADHLQPDPALRDVLLSYPQRRIIFTNADDAHAKRVLNQLEIACCFDQIISILDLSPYCKPQIEAFRIAMQLVGDVRPQDCAFIDDAHRNLDPAEQLGMYAVHVGQRDHSFHRARISTLRDLPRKVGQRERLVLGLGQEGVRAST
jgi:pyrimidine 5'-nucleotidase